MCDTFIAMGDSTLDGSIIFGKNSDRPYDEVQLITFAPRMKYSKAEVLKSTHISIPQVTETSAVLLSQPWWMWGAEMGVNEHGVAIGNESVYTHEPLRKTGLLGMDLLRLGLERGTTAKEALEVIIELLEIFSQGGGCGFNDPWWLYHNSFIITDPKEGYVLETADNWWIVEKVTEIRSISNSISIRGKGDFRKKGIVQYAIEKGYCKSDDEFDFAVTFSGSPISDQPSPYSREEKSKFLLKKNIGQITPRIMMEFLREHQAGICMHGGFESTGSQVSHLRIGKNSIHWFTGTSLPCVSIYKPYIFPIEGQIYNEPGPYSMIDSDWFWCKHTNSKPIKKGKELRDIEEELFKKVDDIINQEENISEEIFLEKMKAINLLAWNKSDAMIKSHIRTKTSN
ncbi:MAG TPA: peptidase C69 [archaeon]|nr:peptidase C69 [archaeon]